MRFFDSLRKSKQGSSFCLSSAGTHFLTEHHEGRPAQTTKPALMKPGKLVRRIVVLGTALLAVTGTVFAQGSITPIYGGGYRFSNGTTATPIYGGGYRFSDGSTTTPIYGGGFRSSDGTTTTPIYGGGFRSSNGVTATPIYGGGYRFSDGTTMTPVYGGGYRINR